MALNLRLREGRKECKEHLYFYQADETSRLAVRVERVNGSRYFVGKGNYKYSCTSTQHHLLIPYPNSKQVLVLVVSKIPSAYKAIS